MAKIKAKFKRDPVKSMSKVASELQVHEKKVRQI
jgi:hypothetical protein